MCPVSPLCEALHHSRGKGWQQSLPDMSRLWHQCNCNLLNVFFLYSQIFLCRKTAGPASGFGVDTTGVHDNHQAHIMQWRQRFISYRLPQSPTLPTTTLKEANYSDRLLGGTGDYDACLGAAALHIVMALEDRNEKGSSSNFWPHSRRQHLAIILFGKTSKSLTDQLVLIN